MAADESSLRSLETLMNEFFDGSTSNERKREIEELLNNFSQTKESWRPCLYYLAHTQNQYVMMYCMTVLESLINRQWMGFSADDKSTIRTMLNRFLLEQHNSVQSFIRNKLVKLVVDIGRIDWPHFYPDFLPSILQLVEQPDTTMLGIILLHTTSEELAVPREDLSMARKEELHKLLLQHVPTILNLLSNVLEMVLEKHRHLVSATPPPSPTHGERSSGRRSSTVMLFSSSPLQSDSFLSEIFKSPGTRITVEALPPLDNGSQQLCVTTLNCIAHYFSWVPLSSTITPSLLSTIFHFAGFGCEIQGSRTMNNGANYSTSSHHLGILAMNCINELLSKNCVPFEFEDYLLQMFQQTFYLLQKLTKDSSTSSTGNRLTELDESYIEKFTDFLRLFVSIHLRRFESNTQFPVVEFLALLFKYTFRQPSNDGFYHCLDIWMTFLDYLLTKSKSRDLNLESIITTYKTALLSLVSHILQKLQFRYNQCQLEELDDETLDDDEETEWQHFLRQCLEVIAKVAEIIPLETFQLLYEPFQESMETYFGLEQFIVNDSSTRRLNVRAETECRRLHCSLRDVSSFLQGLGRLADHFIGEKFAERFNSGSMLMERLIHMIVYGSKVKLYELTSTEQSVLQTDFIEVHAQAMAAVKPYTHWLLQFYTESRQYKQEREKLNNMISTLTDAMVPLFSKDVPEKITHSAAHLVLSVVTTIRPTFYFQLPSVQTLYRSATHGQYSCLNTETQMLLYRTLSMNLLLPWTNTAESDQNWSERATNHNSFSQQMCAQFLHLKDTSSLINNKCAQDTAKPVIKQTLRMLHDWIEALSSEVVKTKQICFTSIQECVRITLAIFPVFIHQPDVVESIMSFFLVLFESLRVQMGVPLTEQTIQTFMGLFSKEQLAEHIYHESSSAHRVIERFLKILEIISKEPGSAFKRFIPSTISICLEYIYPIIAERASPDLKQGMYQLLHEVLMNNWRYFFKGSVLTSLQNQTETVEHSDKFSSIMQSYGQSFLQPDIGVFRQNLESLEKLNSKWKLYNKPIFQQMSFQFLNVLVQTLVHKSHDLLQDEIVVSVYNMAAIDFERFYSEFLLQFLTACEGLDDDQKIVLGRNFKFEKDLPTFTQSVQRFVNDLRYYRQVNSSLPAGSVHF